MESSESLLWSRNARHAYWALPLKMEILLLTSHQHILKLRGERSPTTYLMQMFKNPGTWGVNSEYWISASEIHVKPTSVLRLTGCNKYAEEKISHELLVNWLKSEHQSTTNLDIQAEYQSLTVHEMEYFHCWQPLGRKGKCLVHLKLTCLFSWRIHMIFRTALCI